MPFPPEVEAARAHVFELVGRNVLRFQRLELMMKSAVAGSRISVTDGESPTAYQRHEQATKKKTLGMVSGQFFEDVVMNLPPTNAAAFPKEEAKAEAAGKAHIGFSYKIHFPPDEHLLWKERLRNLIEERNALVHTSLLRMDLESLTGCQQALVALEDQAARVLAEIERLKPLHQGTVEARQTLRALLSNDAFWESAQSSQ